MPLRPAADRAAAAWISRLSFHDLGGFGPSGFEAYARLRFIPDPAWVGQREAEAEVPEGHLSDLDQGRRALDQLAQHTTTPDDCCFCLWDGFSYDREPGGGRAVRLHLPHRSYLLMEGPLEALRTWEIDIGRGGPEVPPAFVWPADHAWCFVSDVDPHWAGIGASATAVQQLLNDPVLDVVRADRELPQPYYA